MKRSLLVLLVICSAFIGAILGTLLTLNYFSQEAAYTSIEHKQNATAVNFKTDTTYRINPALVRRTPGSPRRLRR